MRLRSPPRLLFFPSFTSVKVPHRALSVICAMEPSQRVISDRSASLPELDEAWAAAIDSGLGQLFDTTPPSPLATDSPFLVGGATSFEGALDTLGSQIQRVIAVEAALLKAWNRGNNLIGRNRDLQAQIEEDSAS